ncbi:VOC family protein [Halobaculum sp. CBA1158]|uniref:VOC family protein n=1 Tax=Halobaculum sp. CBA1158 TaxID=2904243 RepID=UPI001F1AF039|nr:VOC family protein [Halobaculum sp. CBA1158]UIO99526.1 VOC family protein [Halobaculum sp. CBA1158]
MLPSRRTVRDPDSTAQATQYPNGDPEESMNLTGLDHLVLRVEDVEESLAFYESIGGEPVTFGEGRRAVALGDQKINLHPLDPDVEPVAAAPTVGSGDLCVLTDEPIESVERDLAEREIEVITGPIERSGAVGPIESVYVRDPDGNLVEIAAYVDG